jgi:hypothetical protein
VEAVPLPAQGPGSHTEIGFGKTDRLECRARLRRERRRRIILHSGRVPLRAPIEPQQIRTLPDMLNRGRIPPRFRGALYGSHGHGHGSLHHQTEQGSKPILPMESHALALIKLT